MRNLIITGGTGLIGRNFLTLQRSQFNNVKVITRDLQSAKKIHKSLDVEYVQIFDLAKIDRRQIMGFDTFFHFADQDISSSHSSRIISHLSNLVKNTGFERFLYLSSIKVYGEYYDSKIRLNQPLNPHTPYATKKVRNEKILRNNFEHTDTKLSIMRVPNIVAPGCKGLVKLLLTLINLGLPVPIENAESPKSFITIPALGELILLSISNQNATDGQAKVYLGSKETYTITYGELISTLSQALGKRPRFLRIGALRANIIKKIPFYGRRFESIYKPFFTENTSLVDESNNGERSDLLESIDSTAKHFFDLKLTAI